MEAKDGPLIKICGITRLVDAHTAIKCGADALGLNFYAPSPRFVDKVTAVEIARVAGDKVLKVGLFVDASTDQVLEILDSVPLDILQFHGSESPEFCAQFGRPWWKAIRVRNAKELAGQLHGYEKASALLLDAWHPDKHGGTGISFDWSVLDTLDVQQHVVLAGGLNPDNVAAAVAQVRPWGVDVSSGVEEAPGLKSEVLMKKFIDEVKRV